MTDIPELEMAPFVPGDETPVVVALFEYQAGARSEEELYRAILEHDTWYVPVTDASHALLWEIDGAFYLGAMHQEIGPYDEACTLMPMGARHLVNHLPSDVNGVAFDLGCPQALGLERADGRGMLDALREQANAQDVEALLSHPAEGDPSLFLDHEWLFLARDGIPSSEQYGGLTSICLFSAGPALRHFLAVMPHLADIQVKRASGHELFAHLAQRADFDAVWINAGRQPAWEPFGPSISYDLLEGRDPRPEARILPARTIAEIHLFLDLQNMAREGRWHQLEYADDELVAHYRGPIVGRDQRGFRFNLVEPSPDPLSYGPGHSRILCAGKLADLVRRRVADFPESYAWEPQQRYDYLLGTARWAAEVEKMLEPDLDIIPRRALRSAHGARFVRERPEIGTRSWLGRARRIAETLAASAR